MIVVLFARKNPKQYSMHLQIVSILYHCGVNSVCTFYKTLEKELFFMFTIFYLVKPLLAKITKLWILSFYIPNNTFICVWNKKEYQLCVSLYIFWSLNTRLKNMPISKNYSIQLLKNGGQHGKICLYLIKRDRVFKLIQIYHTFGFKYAIVWMKVWKKSVSMKTIQTLCYMYLYLCHLYTYSTCLKLNLK